MDIYPLLLNFCIKIVDRIKFELTYGVAYLLIFIKHGRIFILRLYNPR
jgi:hypothetical protein